MDIWKLCLIGYVVGKPFRHTALTKFLSSVWQCTVSLTFHDPGWLIFKFFSKADMLGVTQRGFYLVLGRPLVLKPMHAFFDFSKPDMSTAPVWVLFPNLPLKCWSSLCLSKISKVIGQHLQCDASTNTISRLSFDIVMIMVDLLFDLPLFINILFPDGATLKQSVFFMNFS